MMIFNILYDIYICMTLPQNVPTTANAVPTIEISISTLDPDIGKIVLNDVLQNSSIGDLKVQIQKEFGISFRKQMILNGDVQLQNQARVLENDELFLLIL